MKIVRWCIAPLSLLLTACPVLSFSYSAYVPIEYKANGVCNGVEVTNKKNAGGVGWGILPPEGRADGVNLPEGQAVRIPEPNPAPRSTWYALGSAPLPIGTNLELVLIWRCLPERPEEPIRFVHHHRTSGPRKGLTITEDPSLPSGLRIEVTDFK